MARRLLTLLSALLLALALGQPASTQAAPSETSSVQAAEGRPYTNPVKAQKGADPWISYHDGNYYLVATSWTDVITMRKSPTLAGLATAPSVQVWQGDAASRCCNIWAPELHYSGGRWYLYFVAGQNIADYNPTQRVHVLQSAGTDPMGPYTYRNQLGSTWMLDPSVLTLNGSMYLLGSASGGGTQNLVIAPMSNPYTLSGSFSTISTPTYDWEKSGGTVNEGAEVLQRGGKTFIVYSASGCWTPDYKLGQLTLTGSNPLSASSWTKKSTPVFQRNNPPGCTGRGTTASSPHPTARRAGSSTTPTTRRPTAATTGGRRGHRSSRGTVTGRRTSARPSPSVRHWPGPPARARPRRPRTRWSTGPPGSAWT